MTKSSTGTPAQVVDLDWRPIATLSAMIAAVGGVLYLFDQAPRTSAAVAVGALLAVGINSPVRALQKHVHSRALAVGLTLSLVAGVAALIMTFLVPAAVKQVRDLPAQVTHVVSDLDHLPVVGKALKKNETGTKLEASLKRIPSNLSGNLSPVRRLAKSIADTAVLALAVFLAAVCLLFDGPRFIERMRRFFRGGQTDAFDHAMTIIYASVGRYITGSLAVAGIAGVYVLVVGLVLQVPLAPLAALWVALWDLIPQIGGAAGGLVFVALALTHSPLTGLICIVLFILYLQVENNIISPLVIGKAVKLSPLVTMLAALIGVGLGGVLGALFAVPTVGAIRALYEGRAEITGLWHTT